MRRELLLALAIVCGALALFAGKAFTIDDTLFLWLARHLQESPLDFYGFDVNWYGIDQPMHAVTKNPPLAGYFLALAAALVGWSERALHLAFLVPAAAAVSGTYLLARRMSSRPLEATLIGLLTPAFVVCSTGVMCDTTMLAFWCWSIWCWMRGLDQERQRWLALAAVLAAAAGLSKYFGVSLVPLLAAYTVLRRRRLSRELLHLLVPIAVLAAYQLATQSMYGRGLLLDAADYASAVRASSGSRVGFSKTLIGLAFAGTATLPALAVAPFVWRRGVWTGGLAVLVLLCITAAAGGGLLGIVPVHFESLTYAVRVQHVLLAASGACALALLVQDVRDERDPERWLLALWIAGTLAFASFLNWVDNGRSNLPLAPAVGILLARRLSRAPALASRTQRGLRIAALAGCAGLALAVGYGDLRWANEVRSSAERILAAHARPDRTLWFSGHWGLQHYLESGGARAISIGTDRLEAGDVLVFPSNNVSTLAFAKADVTPLEELEHARGTLVHTVNPRLGVCFYASSLGSTPLAFGSAPPDRYQVVRIDSGFTYELRSTGVQLVRDADRR